MIFFVMFMMNIMKLVINITMEEFRDITTYDGCLYGLWEAGSLGHLRNKRTGRITSGHLEKTGYMRSTLKTVGGKMRHFFVHQLILRTFVGEPPIGKEIVNHKNEIKSDNRVENLEWCDSKYNCNYGTAIERRVKTMKERGSYKNRIISESSRKKMSESQKKRWTDDMRAEKSEQVLGEKNPMYGKKHSEDAIRRSAKGHMKVIYQYSEAGEFIKEWESATAAANYFGVVITAITNAVDGKYKSCGYYWKSRRNG